MGGAVAAVESGYMKQQLVEANTARLEAIERGEQVVVGVNKYLETEPSPLTGGIASIMTVSEEAEHGQIERLKAWRAQRDNGQVAEALAALKRAATEGSNIMPPSIACAKAGVTTGEWGWTLREAFGEYRAPTGVGNAMRNDVDGLDDIRADVDRISKMLGRRMTFLVGKPGLDGHSNGAEQIAVRARDAGMDVVYEGIRLTPAQIARSAIDEGVHVIGLSILSGSHRELIPDVIAALDGADIPVVVGGIIPDADVPELKAAGVAAVYTPKDFELDRIMHDIVALVAQRNAVTV
jgi:(2R)-ethylmalonyl-CoA mutase